VGGTYCGCYSTTQTTQSPGEAAANPHLQVDVNRWVAPIVDAVDGTYCGCYSTTQTTQRPGEAAANPNLQVDVNRWVAPIVDDRWVAPIVDAIRPPKLLKAPGRQ